MCSPSIVQMFTAINIQQTRLCIQMFLYTQNSHGSKTVLEKTACFWIEPYFGIESISNGSLVESTGSTKHYFEKGSWLVKVFGSNYIGLFRWVFEALWGIL